MILKNQVYKKLLLNHLNLDYPRDNITTENQTNQLINFIMNDFLNKFKNDFNNKYVILEFQNDSISLIAYNILKNIQAIENFNLILYGKKSELKKYYKNQKQKRKEKFISKRTLTKLMKIEKGIFVSSRHSVYKVINSKKVFNNFIPCYNIMEKFTIDEIKMSKLFYNIKTNEKKLLGARKVDDLVNLIKGTAFDCESLFKNLDNEIDKINISIIKLTGDNNKDSDLINEVIDTDNLIFYYCTKPTENYQILTSEFQYYLKNKGNIPKKNYLNINTKRIVKYLLQNFKCSVNFIGDFSNREMDDWVD